MGLCGSHRVEHRTLTQGEKMGRPINKRYFGASLADNIKVQFFNGTESVPGYIVKQTGSLGASVSTGSTKYGYDGGSATPFTVAHNTTTKGY